MIRRPPRSTLDRSSAASDVYKRQPQEVAGVLEAAEAAARGGRWAVGFVAYEAGAALDLSLIHISEPTRPY